MEPVLGRFEVFGVSDGVVESGSCGEDLGLDLPGPAAFRSVFTGARVILLVALGVGVSVRRIVFWDSSIDRRRCGFAETRRLFGVIEGARVERFGEEVGDGWVRLLLCSPMCRWECCEVGSCCCW